MPETVRLTPYTALVIFSIGIVISSFVFNSIQMKRPFMGSPVSIADYFKGKGKDHWVGILGGIIWCAGMSLSIIASGKAPKGTKPLLNIMLLLYIAGLAMIIMSK